MTDETDSSKVMIRQISCAFAEYEKARPLSVMYSVGSNSFSCSSTTISSAILSRRVRLPTDKTVCAVYRATHKLDQLPFLSNLFGDMVMLAELAEYMVTPCQSWARRAGFLYQMTALRARFRRNKLAWQSHIRSCHDFVIQVTRTTRRKDRVIVFGSGLLIETPINYLAETFREVILVDAVHGLPERFRISRLPNVRLVEADVTGLINKTPHSSLSLCYMAQSKEAFDLVISSNLLSTLPLFLPANLSDRLNACDADELSSQAIYEHFVNIQRISDRYCLISDYEHLVIDNSLNIERIHLFGSALLPPPCKTWTWNIALRPELFKHKDVYSRVGAWCNLEDI